MTDINFNSTSRNVQLPNIYQEDNQINKFYSKVDEEIENQKHKNTTSRKIQQGNLKDFEKTLKEQKSIQIKRYVEQYFQFFWNIQNLNDLLKQISTVLAPEGKIFRQRSAEQDRQDKFQQQINKPTNFHQTSRSPNMFAQSRLKYQQKEQNFDNLSDLYRILNEKNTQNSKSDQIKSFLMQAIPYKTRSFFQDKRDFQEVFLEQFIPNNILISYDVTNYCMMEVNERIKCYRTELGQMMDKIGSSYYRIIEKLLQASIKLNDDIQKKFDNQIGEFKSMISSLEQEKQVAQTLNRDLKNKYAAQESLYKITKINMDALEDEVELLHSLLAKDGRKLVNQIGQIESIQQEKLKLDEPSEIMMSGLASLKNMISTLETEQNIKNQSMNTMNGLLKAMLKGTKREAFTQVDEGELEYVPSRIYNNKLKGIYMTTDLDNMSSNVSPSFFTNDQDLRSNVEILAKRDKEQAGQVQPSLKIKGGQQTFSSSENWNLTVNLIVILENVSKSQESGRVLPWPYFKTMIYNFYKDMVLNMPEIQSSLMTTTVSMDEYLCLYFIKQYNLRRISEIKIFEFLVSLRYYVKSQPRASLCAMLINITTFPLLTQTDFNFNYKFDIYLQHYFLYAFNKAMEEPKNVSETENQTFITRLHAIEVMNNVLSFAEDFVRQRTLARINKAILKNEETDPQESVDLDRFMDMLIEEYFEGRKKLVRNITKNFSKAYEEESGVFSLASVKNILSDIVYQKSPIEGRNYPKELTAMKVFFYSVTSGKNKFDIQSQDFLFACSRYGFDCPFPFMKTQYFTSSDVRLMEISQQIVTQPKEKKEEDAQSDKNRDRSESKKKQEKTDKDKDEDKNKQFQTTENQLNQFNMESASSLFAQHFSIIRELRQACKNFKENYYKEDDKQILWQDFGNILVSLENACQFLNFPAVI